MPKLKNKCNKVVCRRTPHRLEEGTPEEIAAAMMELIRQSKNEHDSAEKIRRLIADLIKRCGTHRTQNMNQKQRDESMKLFTEVSPALQTIQDKIGQAIEILKENRSDQIMKAAEAGDVDPLHILDLRHGCLPVWYPWVSEKPYGVAGIQWSDSMKIVAGTEVAAFVDTQKTWIMAEVTAVVGNHRYECTDIDDQEKRTAVYARKQIIPMPKYTVDYRYYPHFALPKNAIVLALFPKTTCFYEGIVHRPPQRMSEFYQIRFVDTQMPSNYAAPVEVSDRYVVAFKKDPVMYVRPSKRADAGAEQPDEPTVVAEEQTKSQKKRNKKKEKKKLAELAAMDDKDVPGPAPPPGAPCEDPYADLVARPRSKSAARSRTKSAEPKVKIIRGKIPPHKKAGYNRLFGKRKRKPKKAAAQNVTSTDAQPEADALQASEKMDHGVDQEEGDDVSEHQVLTGLAMYGLEDEREETESEQSSGEDSEDEEGKSDDKKTSEKDEEAVEDESDGADSDIQVIEPEEKDGEDEEEEDQEDEEEEEEEDNEQPKPNDPEVGTSSRQHRSANQSDSDNEKRERSSSARSSSSSSSVESGLSLSDHEHNRKPVHSDHEPEL